MTNKETQRPHPRTAPGILEVQVFVWTSLYRGLLGAAERTGPEALAVTPGDERLHGAWGIALAGLSRKAEAERGLELMPESRDAFKAKYRWEESARTLTTLSAGQ